MTSSQEILRKTARKTLFISDLHLDENHPDTALQFFTLLSDCNFGNVDAIYILGDLFEVWIGDDDDDVFNRQVMAALLATTQKGIPIYLQHGNRDFLIGKRFLRKTGCQLLPDEKKIILYGTPVLLMHGDTLCTADIRYMRWRKDIRNPFVHMFFLLFPLFIRRKIAKKLREYSAHHTRSVSSEIMDVTQKEVERVMTKHEVDFLIHGHTHRPAMHTFFHDQKNKMRIVLAAWHGRGSGLIWDETGKQKVIEL